jgi:cytoskeleton protein RodZ
MAQIPFGEQLKREREMRGVSLEEISAATRIGTRFLEALENEQWDRLPGGVFNRGFIRAVARFLGLDEESLIADYALETQGRVPPATWAPPASPPSRRGLWASLAVLLIAALAGGGWLAYRYSASLLMSRRLHAATAKDSSPQVSPAATTAPGAAVPGPPSVATEGSASPTAEASAPSPPVVSAGTSNPPLVAARSQEMQPLELRVQAPKTVHVTVVADGNTIFTGQLDAGQTRTFQANDGFEVFASEASAVLLELNGQLVPPLGPSGQPGSVTLTRKELKKPLGGRD